MLSDNGDHPMTYLSDTARVVLAAAAQREDLSVLPFPDGVKAKGGAEQKVLASLRKRGFVRIIETAGRPQRIVITSEGMAAIGIEPEDDQTGDEAGPAEADTGATATEPAPGGDTRRPLPRATAGRRRQSVRPRRRRPSRARLRLTRSPHRAPAPSRP